MVERVFHHRLYRRRRRGLLYIARASKRVETRGSRIGLTRENRSGASSRRRPLFWGYSGVPARRAARRTRQHASQGNVALAVFVVVVVGSRCWAERKTGNAGEGRSAVLTRRWERPAVRLTRIEKGPLDAGPRPSSSRSKWNFRAKREREVPSAKGGEELCRRGCWNTASCDRWPVMN